MEITVHVPASAAAVNAAERYAKDLPVPVPACASNGSPPARARSTASTIRSCPSRAVPPIDATARSRTLRDACTGEFGREIGIRTAHDVGALSQMILGIDLTHRVHARDEVTT